jgi:hypothetical protein
LSNNVIAAVDPEINKVLEQEYERQASHLGVVLKIENLSQEQVIVVATTKEPLPHMVQEAVRQIQEVINNV